MHKGLFRALGLVALALVVWVTHRQVLPVGLWLHDTDLSMAPVLEGMFREGDWQAFYFQINYGGTVLTAVRAAWMWIYTFFAPGDLAHYTGNLFFSTIIVGVLFSWSTYFGVRAYCSERAAWVVALLSAIGFQSIVLNAGNEFYLAIVILAPWVLSWVARGQSPWTSWTQWELFWRGAVIGLCIYTFRASLIYAVAVLVPWVVVTDTWKRMFSRDFLKERIHFGLSVLFFGFLLLYLFLDFFGPVLGFYQGRPVKLYAEHNAKFVFLAGVLLAAWSQRDRRFLPEAKNWLKRTGILLGGMVIGFLPEIIYLIGHKFQVPPGNWDSQSLRSSLAMLPRELPRLLEYLMLGRNLPPSYDGLLRLFPLLLLTASVWSILRATPRAALVPILFAGGLTLAAISRVYVSGPAEYRYILPMFPMLLIAIGVLWDRAWLSTQTGFLKWVGRSWVLFLLIGSVSFQLTFRSKQVESIRATGVIEAIFEGVRIFEKAGVEVVVSDDFWHSTQYTWVANRRIYFVSNARRLGPEQGFKLAETASRMGVMLTGRVKPDENQMIQWFGGRFKLERIGAAGDAEFYVGTRVESVK